ncbi:MAG: excinuclease ABC subunit UvrA [Clostridia bacterium]|nr:excinuclease ABC subunit UvrA [Clostridia bacterium]MBR0439049.1 excinuclease ABC subunit UvrA [Clostridia bacterium]MBR3563531.1 excinuclease ABC subunit UvrA [Clostridia bacterium]
MEDFLKIRGAREHNLKSINLDIPRNKLVVFTGLSGSGKSSLAFDTIYAEGQRRYVESLSSYARMFLGQMEKPNMDSIEGLSPAISIDQKTTSRNPRSTVGTVTEVQDYFRILYANAGIPHCPKCGRPIEKQSVDQMLSTILSQGEGDRIILYSPVIRAKKGEHKKVFEQLQKSGYSRVRVDGVQHMLDEEIELEKNNKHTIDAVIDRLRIRNDIERRLSDSLETALKLSGGLAIVQNTDTGEEYLFNEHYSCPECGISIEELSPRMFSFNSPFGACPECTGLGMLLKIDESSLISNRDLSIEEGAVKYSGWNISGLYKWDYHRVRSTAEHYGFSVKTPWKDLREEDRRHILYGSEGEVITMSYTHGDETETYKKEFEGIIPMLERRFRETDSEGVKAEIQRYMYECPCPSCKGKRYRPETLAVTINDKNIAELSDMSIVDCKDFLNNLTLNTKQRAVADRILKELNARLDFMINVGLGYLTLSRSAVSLSGGEAQRIRLATQIGSGLVGVLYILDEPSIGLHQRDNQRLLDSLKGLRDLGNTLIVVEHDEDTIRQADYVVDIGPRAGEHGGEVVAAGTPEEIMACEDSITGDYLSGRKTIPVPRKRRPIEKGYIEIKGAQENNLKKINVKFPVGVITAVTGVSGSGKSTLVNEILYKASARILNDSKERPGKYREINGLEKIDKVINIDQSPIGRTPRSNPATYTGVFDFIRDLFAMSPDAKSRGYEKSRFSFNVKGGRCEACKGDGIIKIGMSFLPDVYVPCEVCKGKRYTRETLEVKYKGKNIYEVLDMTVEEAYDFFKSIPRIEPILKILKDVGLTYIKLGQPSTTLSGGEAQRIKLATYLSKRQTGNTLFILDEPTTGLHSHDVKKLIAILDRLADFGNTIIVIEHNLDIIKCADYIVDLGPEGGDAGGKVIAKGTPEEVAKTEGSATGVFLKRIFDKEKK